MPGSSEGPGRTPGRLFPRGRARFRAWAPHVPAGAVAMVVLVAFPLRGGGQVFSPGELSEAHAQLEGLKNCTQCHQLRTPGVDRDRCLKCHEPLAARIRAGKGYHGSLLEADCGVCHKEHLGRSFRVVRFDPDSFSHDSTGYTLRGSHGEVGCRGCHRPELVVSPDVRDFKEAGGALDRTFLGLGTDCASCHSGDEPHDGQFTDRDCASCHREDTWEDAADFDHSRAGYRLEGRHREVECGLCHVKEGRAAGGEVVRYRPVDASDCDACHQDPHAGRMAGSCSGCHGPEGWGRVRRERVESSFDHGTTGFPLVGAHARAPCESCHDAGSNPEGVRIVFRRGDAGARTYPRPLFDRCGSCHADPHEGVFQGKGCEACHGNEVWTPAGFGLARHDQESRFALTGAHRVTPCLACHQRVEGGRPTLRFRIEDAEDCRSCHRADDPHEGVFSDTRCETCHETGSFQLRGFDHDRVEVQDWVQACSICHAAGQPHGDQFPDRECSACHSTSAFSIPAFDHSGSRFPLDGAHRDLSCHQCHRTEVGPEGQEGEMVRYRPLDPSCVACHGGRP